MMTKQRNPEKETVSPVLAGTEKQTETEADDALLLCLEAIARTEGVQGYIRKDAQTATINFRDPQKTVEYALLSSETFASAKDMEDLFGLGEVKAAVVAFGDLKMVCALVGESSVSVFMDAGVDSEAVLRQLNA
jgi:hypothetical protein